MMTVRAGACIVAALLAAGCGQRGPLVRLPPIGQPPAAVRRPAPPPEPVGQNAPLSPAVADSPFPTGSPGPSTPSTR